MELTRYVIAINHPNDWTVDQAGDACNALDDLNIDPKLAELIRELIQSKPALSDVRVAVV